MSVNIGGVGIGLNFPSQLYPAYLAPASDTSYVPGTNYFSVPAGGVQVVPAGRWQITRGRYSQIQYLDPVTGIWRGFGSVASNGIQVQSDGTNFRFANMTGCPVAAIVTAQGSGYVQSTTTVTANGSGGSTWYPIVGGSINTSVTITSGGTNYSITPTIYFPAPPYPGVAAQGYATLTAGVITSVTITNAGAGYQTAPTPVVIPSPFDPNLGTITNAVLATSLSNNTGKLCAVICTNPGAAVTTVPTLTVSGAGSSATCSAVALCTITDSSASGGANYTTSNLATTVGGQSSASEVAAVVNPAISLSAFVPRAAYGTATVSGGALTGFTWYDTGLFASSDFSSNKPLPIVTGNTAASDPSGALTLSLTIGGAVDGIAIQPI